MGSLEGTFDTKLHDAVRAGDLDGVRTALQQGYDPNLIGLYQWSPLHEAAYNGETEILRMLLEKKGNPNKADYIQSRTAMHYASEHGHIKCLQMLVDAGGRYDIKDDNGKDSLDLVTPGGRKILERLKVRDLMGMSPQEARDTVLESSNCSVGNQSHPLSHDQTHDQSPDLSYDSLSRHSSVSRRSSQDSAFGDKKPVLGYLTLSVEYHSSKGTMKVRVWQLSDLLLPPPHTSMIYTIYVKSYLYPDKKKDSKRKTEEVKVEGSEGHMHLKKRKDKPSAQHVFTPVSFKFDKALEYSGITADIIKEKQLQIDVCITQRYSHRSFMIGMLLLPLKTAIKKVVKEKYPLIPCMNHTIPASMRVYSASELHITSNAARVFYSNPNVRVMIPEDIDDNSEKAVSNPDLKQEYSSSTEVNMSGYPKIVPKLDFSNLTLDESGYSSEQQVSVPGELESPDSVKGKDIVQEIQAFTTIDMDTGKDDKVKKLFKTVKQTISPRDRNVKKLSTCEVIEIEFGDSEADTPRDLKIDQDIPREIRVDQGKVSGVEDWKYHEIKKSSGNKSGDSSSSRPDTPTWDYYDIPVDQPVVVVDNQPQKKQSSPILLPMETTLEVKQKKHDEKTVGKKKDKERSKRRSKKKQEPVPGKAVPLVPQIIVHNPEVKWDDNDAKIDVPDHFQTERKHVYVAETKVTVKDISDNQDAVNFDTEKVPLKEVTVVRPRSGKLKPAKFVIPKMKTTDLNKEERNEPSAPPRSRKKKSKETSEKELHVSLNQPNPNIGKVDKEVISVHGASSAPVFATFADNPNFQRSISDSSAFSRSLSSTSNSSVIVDVDKLSFASSNSHVVELDEDISITELPSDSDMFSHDSELFSTSSEIESSRSKDVEQGKDDFMPMPERFSPAKQVVPVQVYIEENIDSSDEALSHSYTKGLPTTEL